ncbi:MAG: peptide deformylase [Candidatus Sumerlaeota bacterium]|nr:peptide deformylase [Candidatus Sumerlaeota bacterium]
MALREIIIYGNPLLREKSLPVTELTPKLKAIAADMGETMYATHGIGLAAPQVGQTTRLIVVDVEQVKDEDADLSPEKKADQLEFKHRRLQIFYNPEIVSESAEDEVSDEGCLSLPDIRGDVYRPAKVRFRGRNEDFKLVEFDATGLMARVLQHEIDHLDGVLFIDRMNRLKRLTLNPKLARLRKQGAAQAAKK